MGESSGAAKCISIGNSRGLKAGNRNGCHTIDIADRVDESKMTIRLRYSPATQPCGSMRSNVTLEEI